MTTHQCKDYQELSQVAAEWLIQRIRKNPLSKIGVATGNSPLEMYRNITKTGNLNTKSLSLFQLDEWVGLSEYQHSCMSYIEKEVRIPWGISPERAYYFSPGSTLPVNKIQAEEAANFMEKKLDKKGPLDILILGMGKNGHLGFIEPNENWPSDECYVSELASSTQNHNMISSENTPPEFGVTLGIKSILEAKEILFIVTGTEKKGIYSEWLKKVVTPKLPASILWKHPRVSQITDL
ncbi:6-phosphogluconolactonase [Eudoraea sp.]|uniref:6-phosphogluconolactonase n=1 Tax=Eudoraea sp. TaxID=1979955 RepID=UPI003C743204